MDKNKSLSATFCTKCADVNGDLNITPADAQLAFDLYLGKISSPTWCELENADVSSGGTKEAPKITPADAQTIFNKYLKKGAADFTCGANSRHAVSSMTHAAGPAVKLTVNTSMITHGQDILIPIIVESSASVGAFGFDVAFPSDQWTYLGFEKTELTHDFDQLGANVIPSLISPNESRPAPVSRLGFSGFGEVLSSWVSAASRDEWKSPDGLDHQPSSFANLRILRVGGYKIKPTKNPTVGVLITLVFRARGQAQDPNSISIIATYDDIQNASIIEGSPKPMISRTERRPGRSSSHDRGSPGKLDDF